MLCSCACARGNWNGRKSSCGLHFAATRKNISSRNTISIIGAIRKVKGRRRLLKTSLKTSLCIFSSFYFLLFSRIRLTRNSNGHYRTCKDKRQFTMLHILLQTPRSYLFLLLKSPSQILKWWSPTQFCAGNEAFLIRPDAGKLIEG